MNFRRGLQKIDPAAVDEVARSAGQADLLTFALDTRGRPAGRETFFDAVRAVMPLDPPLLSSRSWDALSDSLWEGIRALDAEVVVILWPDATAFKSDAMREYETAIQILADLTDSLADPRATSGRPKEVAVFVGLVPN